MLPREFQPFRFGKRLEPGYFGKRLDSRFRRSPSMENRAIVAGGMSGYFDVLEAMAEQQRLHAMFVRAPPIRRVVGQFTSRIKRHGWNIDLSKFQMSLNDQGVFRKARHLC